MLSRVIAKNIGDVFLWDTVYMKPPLQSRSERGNIQTERSEWRCCAESTWSNRHTILMTQTVSTTSQVRYPHQRSPTDLYYSSISNTRMLDPYVAIAKPFVNAHSRELSWRKISYAVAFDEKAVTFGTARMYVAVSKEYFRTNIFFQKCEISNPQWRRQLWGTAARSPLDFQQFHF